MFKIYKEVSGIELYGSTRGLDKDVKVRCCKIEIVRERWQKRKREIMREWGECKKEGEKWREKQIEKDLKIRRNGDCRRKEERRKRGEEIDMEKERMGVMERV